MSGNKIRMIYSNKRSNEYTDVKNAEDVENKKSLQFEISRNRWKDQRSEIISILINFGLILICLIYFYSLICKNSS